MFHPKNLIPMAGSFVFDGEVNALAHACFDKDIFREFWHGFCFHCSHLHVSQTTELVFRIGNASRPELNGYDYAINVEPSCLCVSAASENDLLLGFMTLIDRIEAIDSEDRTMLQISCCQIHESPVFRTRMAHLCIFPETELWQIQKFLRFCGALRYTHVILEFWGMLKYDCMKELAWEHGYTKEELRPLIREAQDLGLEIVPMFNHWGHAPCSRGAYGKHVVLDQNPALATYFSTSGWCWDIRKPKVRALMKSIRQELCELCNSTYFHIGFDEADEHFIRTQEGMDTVCDYLNEIAEDMAAQGRKIIVWGDIYILTGKRQATSPKEMKLSSALAKLIALEFGYDEQWIMTGEKTSAK